MENNKKRWIAAGLAFIVFLASVFAGSMNKKSSMEMAEERLSSFGSFGSFGTADEVLWGTNPAQRIKVINVDGVIMPDDANDFVVEQLKEAEEDETVAGVMLHIDSPGGSVYASERIAHAVEKVKASGKPVYSVMQSLAASGGYYISAPCDRIYASKETMTGSIGVIAQIYSFEGLFDKYGIKEQTIATGAMKGAGSPGKDLTADQIKWQEELIGNAYDRFVTVVAEGRDMKETDVKKLADGRVYDGAMAIDNGLVDKIGDLEVAVEEMTKELNLTDPMVVQTDQALSYFTKYFPAFGSKINASKSDLQVIQELMETNDNLPMYLYGGYHD